MPDSVRVWLDGEMMQTGLLNVLWIIVFFALALFVRRFAHLLTRRVASASRLMRNRRYPLRVERIETLQRLVASFITFIAFILATIAALRLFIGTENIIWIIGLFTAGIGFAARPIVSDVFTGISFLFEDVFDVGEKVELRVPNEVRGVVEAINLRTTMLRATTGELFTIPNGEVRVIRNFSRGRFSAANVTLRLQSADIAEAITFLEKLGEEAVTLLPNLLEPWQIISETGEIGEHTELTLVAKARFGRAADMRPRLLALVHERLTQAGINLTG